MPERETPNRIRRTMLVWGMLTLAYFLVIGLIIQFATQTDGQGVLGALLITIAYSIAALLFVRQILRTNRATLEQLETSLASQRAKETELERRLRETLLLNHVISAAASSHESQIILEKICAELAHAFDLPQAGVALLNEQRTHETVVAEYRAAGRPSALGVVIPLEGNEATRFVIENRQPLVLANAQTDPRQAALHALEKERGTVSLLIVPLLIHDKVIGTLGLESLTPREFTSEEIALAQRIAIAAGQVLESARLTTELRQELAERRRTEEILRRRNIELDALNVTTLGLINRREPDQLLESIMARAAALMNTAHGFVFVAEPTSQQLKLRVGIGRLAEHQGFELERGQGAAGIVWQTGEPLAVEHYAEWEHHTPEFDGIHAIICVPLRSSLEIVGVLGIAYLEAHRKINVEDIELLDRFGRLASLAMENAHLYAEAQKEIQERRDAQAKLQALLADIERAQTKARSILDAAADSMLMVTPDQRIVSVNWSFCRHLFGGHPREVVGHTLTDFQHEFERVFDQPEEFHQLIHNTVADPEQYFTKTMTQVLPRRRELYTSHGHKLRFFEGLKIQCDQ